ncbi:MAG: hypothetical protein R3A48_26650 [Polyangiales bacterium]
MVVRALAFSLAASLTPGLVRADGRLPAPRQLTEGPAPQQIPDDEPSPAAPPPRTWEVGILAGHVHSLDGSDEPFGATVGARLSLRLSETPLFVRASYLYGTATSPGRTSRSGHGHALLPEVGLAFGGRIEGRATLGIGLVVVPGGGEDVAPVATTSLSIGGRLGTWYLSAEANFAFGNLGTTVVTVGGLGGVAYLFE